MAGERYSRGAARREVPDTVSVRQRPRNDRSTRPDWAQWRRTGRERPWTVGIEEELMLLDPADWSLVSAVEEVLASLPEISSEP